MYRRIKSISSTANDHSINTLPMEDNEGGEYDTKYHHHHRGSVNSMGAATTMSRNNTGLNTKQHSSDIDDIGDGTYQFQVWSEVSVKNTTTRLKFEDARSDELPPFHPLSPTHSQPSVIPAVFTTPLSSSAKQTPFSATTQLPSCASLEETQKQHRSFIQVEEIIALFQIIATHRPRGKRYRPPRDREHRRSRVSSPTAADTLQKKDSDNHLPSADIMRITNWLERAACGQDAIPITETCCSTTYSNESEGDDGDGCPFIPIVSDNFSSSANNSSALYYFNSTAASVASFPCCNNQHCNGVHDDGADPRYSPHQQHQPVFDPSASKRSVSSGPLTSAVDSPSPQFSPVRRESFVDRIREEVHTNMPVPLVLPPSAMPLPDTAPPLPVPVKLPCATLRLCQAAEHARRVNIEHERRIQLKLLTTMLSDGPATSTEAVREAARRRHCSYLSIPTSELEEPLILFTPPPAL